MEGRRRHCNSTYIIHVPKLNLSTVKFLHEILTTSGNIRSGKIPTVRNSSNYNEASEGEWANETATQVRLIRIGSPFYSLGVISLQNLHFFPLTSFSVIMHVILTGATGLIGSGVLAQMLAHMKSGGPITRVSILSRSPVPMAEGKANVVVIRHADFKNYPPEVLKELSGAEACIWALGVSQTQVGKE